MDHRMKSRRRFGASRAAGAAGPALIMALLSMPPLSATVLEIGTGKQLFIDDYVIESLDGTVFKLLNQPLKYAGNPVIEMDQCWEADMHFANSPNLVYDEADRRFKMWNQAVNYSWSTSLLGYYVSEDGLSWEKPPVGQFEYKSDYCRSEASRSHNFVFGNAHRLGAPGVFKDLHETDPAKRYKMLYNRRRPESGVWAAYSADGIQWKDYPYPEVNPVYLNNDTHQAVFWDEQRESYVAHIRLKPPLFADDPRFHFRNRKGNVRTPGIATSPDFIHWDAPKDMRDPVEVNRKYILVPPDAEDGPCTAGFYTFEILQYEGIYVGFLTPYHVCPGMEPEIPPVRGNARNPWMDRIDIQLAFSRDGRVWQRVGNRRTFIPNGPEGSYDAGMIFVAQQPVVREELEEIWIYYVGFERGHWAVRRGGNQESSVSLATLRLDGFVSLTAGQGSVTTKPLVFAGERLEINADTAGPQGEVSAEILDPETGRPIPGYARKDCDAFQGDSVRHAVTWKGKGRVGRLAGQPVQLRFHLKQAKLFSFRFRYGR